MNNVKLIYNSIKLKYADLNILFVTEINNNVYVVTKPTPIYYMKFNGTNNGIGFTIETPDDSKLYAIIIDLIQYCNKLINVDVDYVYSLFNTNVVVNDKYRQIYNRLIKYREQLICNCKRTLFKKMYDIDTHYYDSFDHVINDSKQWPNLAIIKAKQNICDMIDDSCIIGGYVLQEMDFKSSLKYKPDLVQMVINQIQNNQLTDQQILCIAKSTLDKIEQNISKIEEPDNLERTQEYLLYDICNYCCEYKHKINLSDYKNIWFTSDLHLGHSNILKHEPKRWTLFGTTLYKSLCEFINSQNLSQEQIANMSDVDFDNYKTNLCKSLIDKHDNILINKWNKVVGDDDIVFILGDFCFKRGSYANDVLSKLKGHKVLVKGNHENIWITSDTDLSQFEEVCDYKEFNYNNNSFCLSHYPFTTWNKKHYGSIQLYGHIHSNKLNNEQPNQFNVGVDVNNYTPVNIKDIIDKFKQNKGE